MRDLCVLLLLAVLTPAYAADGPRQQLDLDGTWEFRLDPENAGLQQKWFSQSEKFPDSIHVPGAWQAQGFGKPSGNLRHQYSGTAWYRRTVAVPDSWRGKTTLLRIGGAHRRTTVFVNGVELGGHDGFSAPFDFDISSAVRPGVQNTIVLRIENPATTISESPDKQEPVLPTGMLNYIANWGGIFGAVELESVPRTRIESVLVISDVPRRKVSFRVAIKHAGETAPATLRVNIPGAGGVATEVPVSAADAETTVEIAVPGAPLVVPENPRLLTANIQLIETAAKRIAWSSGSASERYRRMATLCYSTASRFTSGAMAMTTSKCSPVSRRLRRPCSSIV